MRWPAWRQCQGSCVKPRAAGGRMSFIEADHSLGSLCVICKSTQLLL